MDKKIKEIINYGIMAPSGDNSQPWRFVVSNGALKIYNLPDKDNPFLNFKQSGSFIAHGALLKNIEIASYEFGLKPKIQLFPLLSEPNLVSIVYFEETNSPEKDSLFQFISQRATNRRPYQNREFDEKENSVFMSIKGNNEVGLRFITKTENKRRAGLGGSSAEIVILENSLLHEYLFKDVMWSKKQENLERHGLYIKTMEFNPIQRLLFKLASYKILMKLAIKVHFPYFIAKQDASLYASGSIIGLLTLKKISSENFVRMGMVMQEIWLKATSLELAFQPITATLFFGFKILNDPSDKVLSQEHKNIILKSYQEISSAFNLSGGEIPFIMFRVGYAKSPSARSSRKEPIIENE